MKKYYMLRPFYGIGITVVSFQMVIQFVLLFFLDGYAWWNVIEHLIMLSTILFLWFYAFACFTSRIEINYEKKEVFILYYFFKKRYKFEDIVSIETRPYNDVAFYIELKTKDAEKTFLYGRYKGTHYRRPTKKITAALDELKTDLMNISNKNY